MKTLQSYRIYSVLALCLLILVVAACSDDGDKGPVFDGPTPKVLLVGIDGISLSELNRVDTPHLDSLHSTKAFTGGHTGTGTQQSTWSGAGWGSILTGVWADSHTVTGNRDYFRYAADTVFNHVRNTRPNAYIANITNWDLIKIQQDAKSEAVDYWFNIDWDREKWDNDEEDSTQITTAEALAQLKDHGPDLLFVMFASVDEVGHVDGFGDTYDDEIRASDAALGELLAAVDAREAAHDEDWLVIVSTDHGRELAEGTDPEDNVVDGKEHGGQTVPEKTIFIKMNKEGNTSFNTEVTGVPNQHDGGLYAFPSQTAITPTILRHLQIDIDDAWELADSPLLGTEGPMRVMFDGEDQNTITWVSSSDNDAVIYRNGEVIGTVPASDEKFVDEDTDVEPRVVNEKKYISYVVSIDGSTGAISQRIAD